MAEGAPRNYEAGQPRARDLETTMSSDCILLHVDFFVRSLDSALEFYCDKLGFSVVDTTVVRGPVARRVSGDHFDALTLVLVRSSLVGAMIELQAFHQDSALTDVASSYTLRTGSVTMLVPDLNDYINKLSARGVCATSERFRVDLPRSRSCEAIFYTDPDGNDLEFLQVLP